MACVAVLCVCGVSCAGGASAAKCRFLFELCASVRNEQLLTHAHANTHAHTYIHTSFNISAAPPLSLSTIDIMDARHDQAGVRYVCVYMHMHTHVTYKGHVLHKEYRESAPRTTAGRQKETCLLTTASVCKIQKKNMLVSAFKKKDMLVSAGDKREKEKRSDSAWVRVPRGHVPRKGINRWHHTCTARAKDACCQATGTRSFVFLSVLCVLATRAGSGGRRTLLEMRLSSNAALRGWCGVKARVLGACSWTGAAQVGLEGGSVEWW